MVTAEDQKVIRRILEGAFNDGDLAAVDRLVAPEAGAHNGRSARSDRKELKDLVVGLRAAFPDLHCTIEQEIQAGSWVAARWTMRGTHQGMLMGNRPTGHTARVEGMIHARMTQARIVEFTILVDRFGMLQQLGLVPSAAVRPSYQGINIEEKDKLKKGRAK
jgi:predicted ester cyclase